MRPLLVLEIVADIADPEIVRSGVCGFSVIEKDRSCEAMSSIGWIDWLIDHIFCIADP